MLNAGKIPGDWETGWLARVGGAAQRLEQERVRRMGWCTVGSGGWEAGCKCEWECVQGARPAGLPANPEWMHGMDGMREERDGGAQ